MKSLLKVFTTELKFFIKSIWLWIAIIILNIYLLQGYNVFYVNGNSLPVQILQSSAYLVVAMTVVGLFIGIISSKRDETVYFNEVFFSLPNSTYSFLARLGAWVWVMLLVIFISYIEMLIFYHISKTNIQGVEFVSLMYMLIYWGLPLLSSMMIGYALGRIIK